MIIKKIKCEKCRHPWIPRTKNPLQCPKCKNQKWKKRTGKK